MIPLRGTYVCIGNGITFECKYDHTKLNQMPATINTFVCEVRSTHFFMIILLFHEIKFWGVNLVQMGNVLVTDSAQPLRTVLPKWSTFAFENIRHGPCQLLMAKPLFLDCFDRVKKYFVLIV